MALGFRDLKGTFLLMGRSTAHFNAEAEFHFPLVASQVLIASPQPAIPDTTVFP